MFWSTPPADGLAPFERLPPEIVDKVAAYLDIYDLKKLRLVNKDTAATATRHIFNELVLSPVRSSWMPASPLTSVQKLNHIVRTPIKDHLQHVIFDIPSVLASTDAEQHDDSDGLEGDQCAPDSLGHWSKTSPS
jgi:hypothetical protein